MWLFGLVQLAGLVGINAAGWWLTTVIARSDTSLVQIGFLSISHQLRNMAGLFPGLLTESQSRGNARGESNQEKTPDQVMAVCTLVTTLVCLLIAGLGITIVPWALTLFYGKAYAAAAATAMALATAVIHMDNSPAAARLSIVRSARRVSSTRFGRCSLRAVPRFSSLSGECLERRSHLPCRPSALGRPGASLPYT